ncbi:MAG: TolC family protein [Betaproteobacteria bacterium]|nr:TolC family protein [Betaproteobacteria bacterium]
MAPRLNSKLMGGASLEAGRRRCPWAAPAPTWGARARARGLWLWLWVACGLGGCASYHAKPLNLDPLLPSDVTRVRVDAARMPLPELAAHRFNPAKGLDMTDVAMLAVVGNPQLKLARDAARVSRAQAFSAGLLPYPRLDLSQDFPTAGPSTSSAFAAGLSYDTAALATYASRSRAAQAAIRSVDLDLLWQEWQVVSEARLLFIRHAEEKALSRLLRAQQALWRERYRYTRRALAQGNTTLDVESADLSALQAVDSALDTDRRKEAGTLHALNALLGLAPETPLDLRGPTAVPRLTRADLERALAQLARRRPDLLALRAGYESEDERYRAAILSQFPAIGIALNRARDTSDVYTVGYGLTLRLPFFNASRGRIAVARATRGALYDAFEVRVMAAKAQALRLFADKKMLEAQLAGVRRGVAALDRAVSEARPAFEAGNINELTFSTLEASLLDRRIEAVHLEDAIFERANALETLVGEQLPNTFRKTQG